ncbi:MAG: ribose-5-phosphate isomerase RpiA [Zetaproteobacteria bacterium]|nr:MAG: ribose-5-phosphate isomerase RpiA [Zetaproteobacteria bacterium]
MDVNALKREVAKKAIEYVPDGAYIGVGTGSTANMFIEELGARVRAGEIKLQGAVASSNETERRLREAGVPVCTLDEALSAVGKLAVYIDGADEFDPNRCLIKGGGGALTREKICAAASAKFVCIVDETKQVEVLGRFPLPIEVIPMAKELVAHYVRTHFGGEARLREGFTTDNGNVILDVHGLAIHDPLLVEDALNALPGVVTNGVFARQRADLVLMGTADGVVTI